MGPPLWGGDGWDGMPPETDVRLAPDAWPAQQGGTDAGNTVGLAPDAWPAPARKSQGSSMASWTAAVTTCWRTVRSSGGNDGSMQRLQ